MAVSGQNALASGKGAHQHEQAGLGQVEVSEQGADQAEVEAGRDEDFRLAGVGLQRAALGLKRAVLESADNGGADGDDAAVFGSGAIDGVGAVAERK